MEAEAVSDTNGIHDSGWMHNSVEYRMGNVKEILIADNMDNVDITEYQKYF